MHLMQAVSLCSIPEILRARDQKSLSYASEEVNTVFQFW